MPHGKVTMYNDARGYGFLDVPGKQDDVFFHVSDVNGPSPLEGEEFKFEVRDEIRGPRAYDLIPL